MDTQSGKAYQSETNRSGNDTLRVTRTRFLFSGKQTGKRLTQSQVQAVCKRPSFVCLPPRTQAGHLRAKKRDNIPQKESTPPEAIRAKFMHTQPALVID